MPDQQLYDLMRRYFNGTATPEEEAAFLQLLEEAGDEEAVKTLMDRVWAEEERDGAVFTPGQSRRMLEGILPAPRTARRITGAVWFRAAAAVLLAALAGGGWWLMKEKNRQHMLLGQQHTAKDIVPGGNKATLTLANGAVIVLEDAKNGTLGQQGNVTVIKLKSGQLAYNSEQQKAAGAPAAFNTLSTPRGGQYQVTLPDGTVVWLNAASSLTFPTAFNGKERMVQLKGEAYFDVAANAQQPFLVQVAGRDMAVKVLGTSFDLSAYPDDQVIRTTLVQGAVKVTGHGGDVVLRPGQQAQLGSQGDMKVITTDVDNAIAWKNGLFSFNDVTIEEVMRQLARWYDVEIVYPDGIPQDRFQGEMFRNESITAVLKILAASGVDFSVDGRKIIVRK